MKTILVVDDMELFREPIAAALRTRGFEAVTAGDGHSALRIARNNRPDLILLDMAMPQMDGLSVLASMRVDARLRDIPVILLTAVAEREYVIRAGRLGVKYYLLKTRFSLDDLVERVNAVLEESDRVSHGPSAQSHAATSVAAEAGKPSAVESDAVPNTDPVMQLKSIKSILTRSQVFTRLDAAGELRGLSPTVAKVLKLTECNTSTIDEIAKVIKQDYAVAIKILRIANSVAFGGRQTIDTIDKAVARLGLGQVRQAMLNLQVVEQFNSPGMCGRINLGQFWEHSMGCAIIASMIAQVRSQEEADLAFTMGLVHDLGRLIFVQEFPDAYSEVLGHAESLGLPLEQVESKLLIVNHAEAMDRLLHTWGFPKELIDPVVFHHLSVDQMRTAVPKRLTEVATLGLADRLCHAMAIGSSGNDSLYSTDEFCEALGLDAEIVARIEAESVQQTRDLKLALLADSREAVWSDSREEWRGRLTGPFRPIVVCEHPALDSVRIFCDQIRANENEAPNIAVVHAGTTEAHAMLGERLRRAEQDEGVAALPTILLGPADAAPADHSAFDGRPCRYLPMPVPLTRFIEAINQLIECQAPSMAA